MKALLPSLLRPGALLLAACLTSSAALAQTISVPTNGQGALFNDQGQSFRATLTGTVTAISVQPAAVTNGATLRLYNGANGSGQVNAVGTPVYSQAGVNLVSAPAGTWQTITLTTPFPVVAGSSYSFILEAQTDLRANVDAYPGGTRLAAFAFVAGGDLAFQVFEVAPVPIPTLSEWALILLAGSLALAGAAAVWRRHRV
jgi:hypothetical protein